MPEITNNETLESERFLANSERSNRDMSDEAALQDLAEFTMVTADSVNNPNLAAKLRDMANELTLNKRTLAAIPGAEGQPVSPEEALAQQGGIQPAPGAAPPAMMAAAGGMPVGPPPM